MAREKILVVNHDLDSLSRIYLALIHRKFNTEACNNAEEIPKRLKRFKPAVIVLDQKEYDTISENLKIPAIVIIEPDHSIVSPMNDGDIQLKKPIHIDELIKAVEKLV
jgi:DNA-binding response OmpR family regulator